MEDPELEELMWEAYYLELLIQMPPTNSWTRYFEGKLEKCKSYLPPGADSATFIAEHGQRMHIAYINQKQKNMEQVKTEELRSVQMTEAELQELEALRAEKRAKEARERAKQEREAYRSLAEETVVQMMPRLKRLNEEMKRTKEAVYEAFRTLIDTKVELYGIDSKQRSHTFRNAESTARITIGYHQRDGWDDSAEVGIAKVREYVHSLAKDEASSQLVEMILELLAKDVQGNLQADKVLQLTRYATKSDSELFREGVQIIQEAYRPERTKLYIRAEERNDEGKWCNIPLDITGV